MKKWLIYTLVFIAPLLVVVFTNESVRLMSTEKGYLSHGITAINSLEPLDDKCTWACHYNTTHCKKNHVKLVTNHFDMIDRLYFGVINTLNSTGSYKLANIIFLVILIPLLNFILLIKSINIRFKLNKK